MFCHELAVLCTSTIKLHFIIQCERNKLEEDEIEANSSGNRQNFLFAGRQAKANALDPGFHCIVQNCSVSNSYLKD